jgi:hypothetical protein
VAILTEKKSWVVHVCPPSNGRKRNKRITVQAGLGKRRDLISKITRIKWTRDVTEAIEGLFCKCEALSSKPNPPHTQKKAGSGVGASSMSKSRNQHLAMYSFLQRQ